MNDYQPGDRVRDTGTGRTGTVLEDTSPDYPDFVAVIWDNGYRTYTNPEFLVLEAGK